MGKTLSREELVELVRRIARTEGTEEEIDDCIRVLRSCVSDPNILNYIFYPEREMTPDEIVDRALAYQPIQLPER